MMQSDSMHSEIVVPWMPKLQYRAKLGNHPESVVNVEAISPVSSTFSSSLASTAPSTPPSSERCPSPDSSLPPDRTNRQRLMASTSSYHLSHNNNNAAERKPPKKRANSFFNFFSVKEPSQQALEDYQRQLRTTGGANSKDGRLDTVGLPGISSAKLPPTVPKVNSKWDGVPHQLIKGKESQKQKRNAHLHLHDYNRSLRSSGSERSGSTNTSSSALSRSSSDHHEPSSCPSLAAAGPLHLHNSTSSTLSDLYGWEKTGSGSIGIRCGGDGHGTRPGGGKKIKDRSKQSLSRKASSYLQAPPPPLPRSVPDQYLEQNLSDLGALLGPPTGHSSSPSLDLDKQSELSSPGESLNAPLGHFQNSVIIPPASSPEEPLAPSFSSKEESIPGNRPNHLALTNSFSSPSSSSSNSTTTISKTTRTAPSPSSPTTENNEMMIHPTVIDEAIAPWVHPSYHLSSAAVPAHQTRKKKSVRGIFSGK